MKRVIIILSLLFLVPSVYAVNLSDSLIFSASYLRADLWSYNCINETGKTYNACLDLYYNYAKPRSIKMMKASALAMQKRYDDKKRAEQMELQNLRKVAIEKERKIEQRINYIVDMLDKEFTEGN